MPTNTIRAVDVINWFRNADTEIAELTLLNAQQIVQAAIEARQKRLRGLEKARAAKTGKGSAAASERAKRAWATRKANAAAAAGQGQGQVAQPIPVAAAGFQQEEA